MNIIKCKDKDLDDLYDESALTFLGCALTDDNLDYLEKWFLEHDCKLIHDDVYVVSGKLMNEKYDLQGSNAYKDDLSIVCIKLSDLSNVNNIVLARFELDGKWFDDIVDNNSMR
jgi:hypothetical protein